MYDVTWNVCTSHTRCKMHKSPLRLQMGPPLNLSTSPACQYPGHQLQPLQTDPLTFHPCGKQEGPVGQHQAGLWYGSQSKIEISKEKQGWKASPMETILDVFEQEHELPFSMEPIIHALQVCKSKKLLIQAKRAHTYMCQLGLECHGDLGSHLVELFVQCDCMLNAQRAFSRLTCRSEYCWTAIILGYAEYGDARCSFDNYQNMKQDGILPSRFTFLALLKACIKLKCAEKAREIHDEISNYGFDGNLVIRNSLVDMYAKCGFLAQAQEAFDKAPSRDVITWNILLAGYAEHNMNKQVLYFSHLMHDDRIYPNAFTFVSILKACRNLKDLKRGLMLHEEIAMEGYEDDPFVSSSLLDLYAKGGFLDEAKDVFDANPLRDVVMWTTLIMGYTEHGHNEKALDCLGRMQRDGVSPNPSTFVCILKACCSLRAIHKGQEIYSDAFKTGFSGELFLGNTLVDMYAKCGLLDDARKVFDTLLVRDAVTWSALLSGYAEQGFGQEVLDGFQRMKEDNVPLTATTSLCILKACGILEALDQGQSVHLEIVQEGLEEDGFVCCALVDMYAKCGLLKEAQDVLDDSSVKDVVMWTTLIAGYADAGLGEEALTSLDHMLQERLSADGATFVCSLKACISMGALDKGRNLHSDAIKQGLEWNAYVCNSLIELYSTFSSSIDALSVFDRLPTKDIVSWNSLIAGFAEQNFHEEVLDCFEQMQAENVQPNAGSFICALQSCASLEAVEKGRDLHTKIVENQLEDDLYVGNNLVELYAKVGLLTEAQEVLEELPSHDVFSWNALIGGYVEQGFGEEPLAFAEKMQLEGIAMSPVTFMFCLKACNILRDMDKGRELHNEIIRKGLDRDPALGNTVIDMYCKCGASAEAEYVLGKLPYCDSVSWAVLIANHAEDGLYKRVLECFDIMRLQGISPDIPTYICSLKASMSLKDEQRSRELHAEILKRGLDSNLAENAVLDTYVKQGLLADAGMMFKMMPSRNVFSWTSMIQGYIANFQDEEALSCFDQMEEAPPDGVTCACILKACGRLQLMHKGREIHCDIVKKGFEGDSFAGNALVDMYAKVGSLLDAREVLSELPKRDPVSWNALCAGYAEAGLGTEALTCFEQMQLEGVCADVVLWSTLISVYINQGDNSKALQVYHLILEQGLIPDTMVYLSVLQACCNASALEMGRAIHAQLNEDGFEPLNPVLLTAFVVLYSKCGSMYEAQQVFDAMIVKDLVAWNALLMGYCRQGDKELVLSLFDQMRAVGIQPDRVAFLTVLTGCSHAGLMAEAQEYFELMIREYDLAPTVEHFNCMADLLGRAGHLREAVFMLDNMPVQPDSVAWSTMLGACHKWGDIELGRQAFEGAVSLDEDNSSAFVMMSNISVDCARKSPAIKAQSTGWKQH